MDIGFQEEGFVKAKRASKVNNCWKDSPEFALKDWTCDIFQAPILNIQFSGSYLSIDKTTVVFFQMG